MKASYIIGGLLLYLSMIAPAAIAETTNRPPVSVLVGLSDGRVQYEVDSKPVRSEKILEVFHEVKKQRDGRDTPVVVLVDERNSLTTLANIRGIINKAGFSHVRYFVVNADRTMMQETIERPAVPFSVNPAPDGEQRAKPTAEK